MIVDMTGIPLYPGNMGRDCLGNGQHPGVECCCEECGYLLCCIGAENCAACGDRKCPRNPTCTLQNSPIDAIMVTEIETEDDTMARKSTKENKNIYQRTREGLELTREEAADLLVTMAPERIEKIENERTLPHPDEVLLMSDKYKTPTLCNYYCANQCPIGQQYVPEVKVKDLSQIVLETLASLNTVQKKKERLIEITVDGHISDDELADFIRIQEELEKISIAVETLQLWCEQMLDTGVIDRARYNLLKSEE